MRRPSRQGRRRPDWMRTPQELEGPPTETQSRVLGILHRGIQTQDDLDFLAAGDKEPRPRARPTQWEDAEMEALAIGVYRKWWWPGYVRWEARSHDARRLERLARQGAMAGWPDCGLFIPAVLGVGGCHAVAAVVEVKREGLRPRRDPGPRWWLEDWGPGSRYGVSAEQGRRLRELAGCGLSTFVAHGAGEALEWLDRQAGPRPDVLPDGWDEPAGPDDWAGA